MSLFGLRVCACVCCLSMYVQVQIRARIFQSTLALWARQACGYIWAEFRLVFNASVKASTLDCRLCRCVECVACVWRAPGGRVEGNAAYTIRDSLQKWPQVVRAAERWQSGNAHKRRKWKLFPFAFSFPYSFGFNALSLRFAVTQRNAAQRNTNSKAMWPKRSSQL